MIARRGAAALLLGTLLVPALAAPALAAEDPATGYWTRTRVGAPLPVQPPDPVPEGGSWVSGDPVGPVAVTAVRATADDGSAVVGLRLAIADSAGAPEVLVCPTLERWAPEQGGRLEAAPAADCSAPVEAVVEEESLVVDLPLALQGEVVDVLLTPAPGSAFSVTFERATADSVVQAPVVAPAEPAPPLPPAPPASGDGFAPAPPPFDRGTGFGTADLGTPATAPEPLLPAPALPEPAAAPVPRPQAAPPATPPSLTMRPAATPVDRTGSLLAVALLVGTAALAARLAVQPVAPPRHLGGGARLSRAAGAPAPAAVARPTAPDRGVGRFRSARVRPPVRI